VLSSAANPRRTLLPDGTYKNQAELVIVVVDGRISRILPASGEAIEVASIRVKANRTVAITPSTNALAAVSEITLPSGIFTSADGTSTFTVIQGRPAAFTIGDGRTPPR
jgi:hypothetical protein